MIEFEELVTTLSPSKKYRIEIKSRDYARIIDIQADKVIFSSPVYDIYHFWFERDGEEWVQFSPKADKQCFFNCTTGQAYDHEKNGFCWTDCFVNPSNTVVAVDGCYWGGPWEVRFYDILNLAKGWPELEIEADGYPEGFAMWIRDSCSIEWLKGDTIKIGPVEAMDMGLCEEPERESDVVLKLKGSKMHVKSISGEK